MQTAFEFRRESAGRESCRMGREDSHERFNRWLVGGLSLASLAAGIALLATGRGQGLWTGSFIRLGVLLAALWLALPTRGRAAAWAGISPWWIVGSCAALLVILKNPRATLPVLGISLAALAVINLLTGRSRQR